jgi:hypothetical protein
MEGHDGNYPPHESRPAPVVHPRRLDTPVSAARGLWITELRAEVKRLQSRLDDSNDASRDLIALQARMLKDQGVTIVAPRTRDDA